MCQKADRFAFAEIVRRVARDHGHGLADSLIGFNELHVDALDLAELGWRESGHGHHGSQSDAFERRVVDSTHLANRLFRIVQFQFGEDPLASLLVVLGQGARAVMRLTVVVAPELWLSERACD